MRIVHKRWALQIYGDRMSISDSEGKVIYEGHKPEDALCTEERLREIIEIKQKERGTK
jgi:hypothetical protein